MQNWIESAKNGIKLFAGGMNEWDARYKELDKRYREQENTEIHDLVHAFNLTPEQLGQLLRQTAQSLPSPEAVNQVVKEDATDED